MNLGLGIVLVYRLVLVGFVGYVDPPYWTLWCDQCSDV
jgi:hypothetical protein